MRNPIKLLLDWLVSRSSTYKNLLSDFQRLNKDFEDVISKRTTFTDIATRNGAITIGAATETAGIIAAQFLKWLDETEAANYVELMFKEKGTADKAPRQVLVTVQRVEGKTPHQIRQELEEGYREIAHYLGVGGYNAENLTPQQLIDKVKEGIQIQEDNIRDFYQAKNK